MLMDSQPNGENYLNQLRGIKELSIVWKIRKDSLTPVAVYIDWRPNQDFLDFVWSPTIHSLGYRALGTELSVPPKNPVLLIRIVTYLAFLKLFVLQLRTQQAQGYSIVKSSNSSEHGVQDLLQQFIIYLSNHNFHSCQE